MLVGNSNQEITPKSIENKRNRPKHKTGQIRAKSAIGGNSFFPSKMHET